MFNVVKDLFKRFGVLCRSVIILVGSSAAKIFLSKWSTKKTRYVVKFCAQETNYMNFQEKCCSM